MPVESVVVITFPDGRMDRKNAARYTGLAVKTLAMHATRGTGPRYVKRGRVFYFQKDLDAWLQAGEAKSTAQAARFRGSAPDSKEKRRGKGPGEKAATVERTASPKRLG